MKAIMSRGLGLPCQLRRDARSMPLAPPLAPHPCPCSVFERFRAVLHEGEIDKRVQFIIEGLFAIRKAGFDGSGFKAIKPELDLVEAGKCGPGVEGINSGGSCCCATTLSIYLFLDLYFSFG